MHAVGVVAGAGEVPGERVARYINVVHAVHRYAGPHVYVGAAHIRLIDEVMPCRVQDRYESVGGAADGLFIDIRPQSRVEERIAAFAGDIGLARAVDGDRIAGIYAGAAQIGGVHLVSGGVELSHERVGLRAGHGEGLGRERRRRETGEGREA